MQYRKKICCILLIPLIAFFSYRFYTEVTHQPVAKIEKKLEQLSLTYSEKQEGSEKQKDIEINIFGVKRAQMAIAEYQSNTTSGGEKYTGGETAQWCTYFATWVTNQAGSPVGDAEKQFLIGNSFVLKSYLQTSGTFYEKDVILEKNLQPEIGDFLIFQRGKLSQQLGHVYIVVNILDNGHVDVISGNVKNRIKLDEDLDYLNSHGFLGFGRPEK